MKEFKTQKFQKDQYVVIFGSNFLDKVYLVLKGTAKKRVMGKIYDVKAGNFINLISALCQRTQVTSVKAVSDLEVMVIPIEKITEVFKYESIVLKMFHEISFFSKEIVNRYLTGQEFRVEEHQDYLFNLGKYLFDKNLYERANYVFKILLKYYPNMKLGKEVDEYLEEITTNISHKPETNNIYGIGETIYTQFEEDNRFVFLKRGEVKFYMFKGNYEHYVGTIKAKTIFGQMSFHSTFRDLTCVSSSDKTEVVFIEAKDFENFTKSQNSQTLLNIMTEFSQRIWKSSMFLEHIQTFKEDGNIYNQIYDVLYTLYEVENNDKNANSFNFKITIEEIFQSTILPDKFRLEDATKVINESSFLHINNDNKVVCDDIRFLYAKCYKSRQQKEKTRNEAL